MAKNSFATKNADYLIPEQEFKKYGCNNVEQLNCRDAVLQDFVLSYYIMKVSLPTAKYV